MFYKITLFDENCASFVSGVEMFFTEDVECFEKNYFSSDQYDEVKERYLKSKAGEIVTDYYTDSPECNIFQYDAHSNILERKYFSFEKKFFLLRNFWGFLKKVYAEKAEVTIAKILFHGTYYIIGKYKLSGVCEEDYLENDSYRTCYVCGNPIILKSYHEGKRSKNKEDFSECALETYAWVTMKDSKENLPLPEVLSEEEIADLMRDIPGADG